MEAATLASVQEQAPGYLDRARVVGHNIIESVSDFVDNQTLRKLSAGLAVAAIAVFSTGGGIALADTGPTGSTGTTGSTTGATGETGSIITTINTSGGHIIHRHSSLKPQTVINRIALAMSPDILPQYPNKKEDQQIPTSASLSPSSFEFRGNCIGGNNVFKYYEISPAGTAYMSCSVVGTPTTASSQPNEYSVRLNQLGDTIQKSVKLPLSDATEPTISVSGSSNKAIADYQCPVQSKSGVKQVVLQSVKKRSYSKATISTC